ncbi:MAG TPA: SDR family NAD(P)-dependent oxidoreductase [Frankiaceae bacterium]|nr:SDR family NAD(P)-dependent oxidoreductase [Frankiaceae bacterium]
MSALKDRVVLVTGGGAGIGQAVCQSCADAGAHVIVTALSDNGEQTAAQITASGGSAHFVQADVSSLEDMERAVADGVARFGGLDGVVHNATSRHSSSVTALADLDPAVLDDHLAVSVGGAFNCAKAALPHLRERRGRLVLMTSPAAMEGSSTLPAYGTVKGALRGFAKSLALEEGPNGVNVTAVSPLAVTPALYRAFESNPNLEPRLRQLVPLGWVGDPFLDIAPVLTFLLGDGARYVTGQTLVVDGGLKRFLF